MRNFSLLIGLTFLFFSCGNSDQLFPKKYLGKYHGVQEAYKIKMNGESVEVPQTEYDVVLDNGKLWLTSPRQTIEANYDVKATTKMYYNLKVVFENDIVEEWQLWKKGKRLIRIPTTPQPKVTFVTK